MKFCDLHLHTIYSDSTYTPSDLIRETSCAGIEVIAVTDHDTVSGIMPVIEAAKSTTIEVIAGIELTTEHDGQEIHVLGYFIDFQKKAFVEKINFLQERRIERIYRMVERLKEMGVSLSADDVFALSQNKNSVGRMHIARAIVKAGYCKSTTEAFTKYIGDKSPAYVCGFRFSPSEAIQLIKDTKGVSVLAHPYSLNNDDLIPLLVSEGIQGLEVYYPEHTLQMTQHYKGLAAKYSLLITGGSDCHGDVKPQAHLGSIRVPYELVEKLKSARGK